MKILLSAFAFSPILGSECGVGWNWALQLAKQHKVTVLTHAWFRTDVEAFLQQHPVANLQVEYFHVEPIKGAFKRSHLDSQVYYAWWQIKVLAFARTLHAREQFDLVHHLTWGTFRYPSWLGFLGPRFVVGPLGGGERAPWRLFKDVPVKQRFKEVLRDVVVWSFKLDPLTQWAWSRADKVFCRTDETASVMPRRLAGRLAVVNEIGAPPVVPRSAPVVQKGRTHFLFAGRLLAWKGSQLALEAVVQAIRRGADVSLTIVGDGDLHDLLHQRMLAQGVSGRVSLLARIPQADLMSLYHQADAFLFPSMHDSGGNVVLESLSRGLPVICLDLGGPKHFIHDGCGVVVSTQGVSHADLVSRLADEVVKFAQLNDRQRQSLHDAAIAQAAKLTWEHQVKQVYGVLVDD